MLFGFQRPELSMRASSCRTTARPATARCAEWIEQGDVFALAEKTDRKATPAELPVTIIEPSRDQFGYDIV